MIEATDSVSATNKDAMEIKNIFFLGIGLFAIAVSVWSRMGRTKRSRWWVDMGASESVALMIAPSIAIFATFAGLGPLIGDIESLSVPLGLLLFAAVILTIWGGIVLHIPRWFYPRWYRLNKGWTKPSDGQTRSKATSSNTERWHHSSGFSMPLPQDWIHAEREDPLVALMAIEPSANGCVLQNKVVITINGVHTQTFDQWQAEADKALVVTLHDWHLIDSERVTIDGHPGLRRLGHHANSDNEPIVLEQWATMVDRVGYTVSFSVRTMSYDGLADQFAMLASGIELPKHPVAS